MVLLMITGKSSFFIFFHFDCNERSLQIRQYPVFKFMSNYSLRIVFSYVALV